MSETNTNGRSNGNGAATTNKARLLLSVSIPNTLPNSFKAQAEMAFDMSARGADMQDKGAYVLAHVVLSAVPELHKAGKLPHDLAWYAVRMDDKKAREELGIALRDEDVLDIKTPSEISERPRKGKDGVITGERLSVEAEAKYQARRVALNRAITLALCIWLSNNKLHKGARPIQFNPRFMSFECPAEHIAGLVSKVTKDGERVVPKLASDTKGRLFVMQRQAHVVNLVDVDSQRIVVSGASLVALVTRKDADAAANLIKSHEQAAAFCKRLPETVLDLRKVFGDTADNDSAFTVLVEKLAKVNADAVMRIARAAQMQRTAKAKAKDKAS